MSSRFLVDIEQLLAHANELAQKVYHAYEPKEERPVGKMPDIYFSLPPPRSENKPFPANGAYLMVVLHNISGHRPQIEHAHALEALLDEDPLVLSELISNQYAVELPQGVLVYEVPVNVAEFDGTAERLKTMLMHAQTHGFKYNPDNRELREIRQDFHKGIVNFGKSGRSKVDLLDQGALPRLRHS